MIRVTDRSQMMNYLSPAWLNPNAAAKEIFEYVSTTRSLVVEQFGARHLFVERDDTTFATELPPPLLYRVRHQPLHLQKNIPEVCLKGHVSSTILKADSEDDNFVVLRDDICKSRSRIVR